jgi:hypothetical protein
LFIPVVPIDCDMGPWSEWSEMIEGGTVTRSRRIRKRGNKIGKECGPLYYFGYFNSKRGLNSDT